MPLFADRDVNLVGLEHPSDVGLIRRPGAQPFEGRFLVTESLQEGVREFDRIERGIGQRRNCLFYLNCVQLLILRFNSKIRRFTCLASRTNIAFREARELEFAMT